MNNIFYQNATGNLLLVKKIDKIIKDLEIEGFNMARMISHSKTFYRKHNPYNEIYFNANIFINHDNKFKKIWYGDLDITKDGYKLKEIAFNNNTIFYILLEMDGRFENETTQSVVFKSIWNTTKDLLIIDEDYIALKEKEANIRKINYLKKQKEITRNNIKENKKYKIKNVNKILNYKIIKKLVIQNKDFNSFYKDKQDLYLEILNDKNIDLWDKREKLRRVTPFSYDFVESLIRKELKLSDKINPSNFWGTTKLLKNLSKKDLEIINFLIDKYNSLLTKEDIEDDLKLEFLKDLNHYYLAEYTIELANKDKININSFKDDTIYVLDR